MAVVSSNIEVSTPATRALKGPLIRVQIRPGQFEKMYEADAIASGLIPAKKQEPAQDKQRQPTQDKMQRPGEDKAPPPKEDKPAADDLTTITGIGLATARLMAARGITTFDALRAASEAGKLGFLPSAAQTAIGKWANG